MKRVKHDGIPEKADESEILIAYAKCQGRAPKNIEVARKHAIQCGWCKRHILLFKKARENKVFINQD